MEEWETIERPGYFGKKRDELVRGWNSKFGEGNWLLAYEWGNLVLPRSEGIQIYEDGYCEFLKSHKNIFAWLIISASDVYDTAPTNINAKFDYNYPQETASNHVHDIAIRRAVMRLGKWFSGDKLLEVRSRNGEGWVLSPCMVPFHMPEMISREKIKDYSGKGEWWRRVGINYSVEEFYQQNKLLQVRK